MRRIAVDSSADGVEEEDEEEQLANRVVVALTAGTASEAVDPPQEAEGSGVSSE
jgi:hypothetical protein